MWIERWIREEHLKPRQHPKPTTSKSCIISTCTCSFKNVHLVNIKALERLWVPTQFSIKRFVSISISRGGGFFSFSFSFPSPSIWELFCWFHMATTCMPNISTSQVKVLLPWCSRSFWVKSVEIQVFPSPTSFMLIFMHASMVPILSGIANPTNMARKYSLTWLGLLQFSTKLIQQICNLAGKPAQLTL